MAFTFETPKNANKPRKSILIKRIHSKQEGVTSPKSFSSVSKDDGYPTDSGFFSKFKQNFTFNNNKVDIEKAGEQNREGKKLTYLEARALNEYGAMLSEKNNDHEGAIVTLMRVRNSTSNRRTYCFIPCLSSSY